MTGETEKEAENDRKTRKTARIDRRTGNRG
jgi:hypothetical protein